MPTQYQITLCTCPDKDTAEKIARLLVNDKLAACVNILPGITSVYRWHEQVESAQEHLLLIKANKSRYQAIETTIKKHHPYELPEIIAVPIEDGLPEYLHWIDSCHFYN
ncbi:MAG: divalent-cation tolerance protein CutA [Methylococcaceae bacterium]|jgi:periplasmic divalent cation tolerance protein|nr:divalent-cation tolerance protein CutA [Methylococcaceae bacterium]